MVVGKTFGEHLERLGIRKLETRRFSIGVQANGGVQSVDVMVPAEQLPAPQQRLLGLGAPA